MLILNEKHFLAHWRVYYSLHFIIESFMNSPFRTMCQEKEAKTHTQQCLCIYINDNWNQYLGFYVWRKEVNLFAFLYIPFQPFFLCSCFYSRYKSISTSGMNFLSSSLLHSNIIYSSNKTNQFHSLHVTCIHSAPCHHPGEVITRILTKKKWMRRS